MKRADKIDPCSNVHCLCRAVKTPVYRAYNCTGVERHMKDIGLPHQQLKEMNIMKTASSEFVGLRKKCDNHPRSRCRPIQIICAHHFDTYGVVLMYKNHEQNNNNNNNNSTDNF